VRLPFAPRAWAAFLARQLCALPAVGLSALALPRDRGILGRAADWAAHAFGPRIRSRVGKHCSPVAKGFGYVYRFHFLRFFCTLLNSASLSAISFLKLSLALSVLLFRFGIQRATLGSVRLCLGSGDDSPRKNTAFEDGNVEVRTLDPEGGSDPRTGRVLVAAYA